MEVWSTKGFEKRVNLSDEALAQQVAKHYFKRWEEECAAGDDSASSSTKQRAGAKSGKTNTCSKTIDDFDSYCTMVAKARTCRHEAAWSRKLKAAATERKNELDQSKLAAGRSNEEASANKENSNTNKVAVPLAAFECGFFGDLDGDISEEEV